LRTYYHCLPCGAANLAADQDDDLPLGVRLADVTQRFADLAQREPACSCVRSWSSNLSVIAAT